MAEKRNDMEGRHMKRSMLAVVIFLCFVVGICFAEGQGANKGVGRQMREFKREQRTENREHRMHQKTKKRAHRMQRKAENKEFHDSLKGMTLEQKRAAVAAHHRDQHAENKTFREQQKVETKAEIEKVKAEKQAGQQ